MDRLFPAAAISALCNSGGAFLKLCCALLPLPYTPLAPGAFLVPAKQDDTASKALQEFRAMTGPTPEAGQADRLHELDVQILTQTKNGRAGAKALTCRSPRASAGLVTSVGLRPPCVTSAAHPSV
jgi:hypothetical protein